ncbi:hypothetical protein D3260_10710 [Salinisphaera sp. Q1T1-3]|nr:hypothetical protein D3260_10710 [Salinisphaera sp. Q1T1-3]
MIDARARAVTYPRPAQRELAREMDGIRHPLSPGAMSVVHCRISLDTRQRRWPCHARTKPGTHHVNDRDARRIADMELLINIT